MEELTRDDIARIARMDEQISGLRDDMKDIRQDNREIKQSIMGFTAVVEKQTELYISSMKELTERHYTKEEIGLMVESREKQEKTQDDKIVAVVKTTDDHETRLGSIEKKVAWFGGVLAVLGVLLSVGEVLLRVYGKA